MKRIPPTPDRTMRDTPEYRRLVHAAVIWEHSGPYDSLHELSGKAQTLRSHSASTRWADAECRNRIELGIALYDAGAREIVADYLDARRTRADLSDIFGMFGMSL